MSQTPLKFWIEQWGINLDWEAKAALSAAVTEEVKKEIAELKGQISVRPLKSIATCDLVNEFKTREAVSHYAVDPYEIYNVEVDGKKVMKDAPDSGPAILFIVWD